MALRFQDHLHIIEIRENQLLAALECFEAALRPKFHQALLRVYVEALIAFHFAKLDTGPHEMRRQTRTAEFLSNRESLDLGEIGEITNAHAAGGLVADVTEKMRRREVVTVEFLLVRTLLLGDVNGGTNRHYPHKVFDGPRDRHAELGLLGSRRIMLALRGTLRCIGSAIHMQERCRDPLVGSAALKTRRFQ